MSFIDELRHSILEWDNKKTISLLWKIGKIKEDDALEFEDIFLWCIKSNKNKIKLLWLKNLSKIANKKHIPMLEQIIWSNEPSDIQREAISCIWRMRNRENIDILFRVLEHRNPEIILQGIRWLLVFKGDEEIDNILKKLKNHKNELVKMVIEKEYYNDNKRSEHNHTFVDEKLKNTVVKWDVLSILEKVKDCSFHLTFTSPPYYNARDYSIYWSYQEYLDFLSDVFEKIFHKTKEWRFLIVNTSPVIVPRLWRNYSSKRYPIPFDIHGILIKLWWEFIDDIVWVKPEASVKNRIGWFQQHRKPLAYKPNPRSEMIMVYRKKTTKLLDRNMKQYDKKTIDDSKITWNFDTSNIWEIDPTFDKTHSAVFPIELCNKVIDYYSYKWDLVFDPFAWSGTLGKAALGKWRSIFLAEIDDRYFDRIKENLAWFNGVKYTTL